MTTWIQNFDPFKNIVLSALVAVVPILFLGWALLIQKMKGHFAALFTLILTVLLAIFVNAMPAPLALMTGFHGILFGLFPICWIIIPAVFLFNVTVKSGQFEVIKSFMASIIHTMVFFSTFSPTLTKVASSGEGAA